MAYLQTRCGCKGEREIPFPPNKEILVPLTRRAPSPIQTEITETPLMEIRRFVLKDWYGNPKDGYAFYEERAE